MVDEFLESVEKSNSLFKQAETLKDPLQAISLLKKANELALKNIDRFHYSQLMRLPILLKKVGQFEDAKREELKIIIANNEFKKLRTANLWTNLTEKYSSNFSVIIKSGSINNTCNIHSAIWNEKLEGTSLNWDKYISKLYESENCRCWLIISSLGEYKFNKDASVLPLSDKNYTKHVADRLQSMNHDVVSSIHSFSEEQKDNKLNVLSKDYTKNPYINVKKTNDKNDKKPTIVAKYTTHKSKTTDGLDANNSNNLKDRTPQAYQQVKLNRDNKNSEQANDVITKEISLDHKDSDKLVKKQHHNKLNTKIQTNNNDSTNNNLINKDDIALNIENIPNNIKALNEQDNLTSTPNNITKLQDDIVPVLIKVDMLVKDANLTPNHLNTYKSSITMNNLDNEGQKLSETNLSFNSSLLLNNSEFNHNYHTNKKNMFDNFVEDGELNMVILTHLNIAKLNNKDLLEGVLFGLFNYYKSNNIDFSKTLESSDSHDSLITNTNIEGEILLENNFNNIVSPLNNVLLENGNITSLNEDSLNNNTNIESNVVLKRYDTSPNNNVEIVDESKKFVNAELPTKAIVENALRDALYLENDLPVDIKNRNQLLAQQVDPPKPQHGNNNIVAQSSSDIYSLQDYTKLTVIDDTEDTKHEWSDTEVIKEYKVVDKNLQSVSTNKIDAILWYIFLILVVIDCIVIQVRFF